MENQSRAASGSYSPYQDRTDFSNDDGPSLESEPKTRKRRRCTGIEDIDGNLIVIQTDDMGIPYFRKESFDAFGTRLGYIVRRDIPICYEDWKKVPDDFKKKAVDAIGLQFIFEDEETVNTAYTMGKMNDYWRTYKCELNKDYVEDRNPVLVKQHAPDGIPLEDWRKFVDMCNTEDFKAKSKKNTHNRSLQKMPSCIGRKSSAVLRYEMANEKGVPYSAIGRPEAYIRMHTKSDKTPQNKELEDEIIKYMADHPESSKTGIHDAVAKVVKHDKERRMLVFGGGLSKTSYRKMKPLMKKNEGLKESRDYYQNKIKELEATIEANAAKANADMEEIKSMLRNQGRTYMNDYSPPHRSSSNSGRNPPGCAGERISQHDLTNGYTSGQGVYGEDSYHVDAYGRTSQPDHSYERMTQRKRVFGPVIQAERAYGQGNQHEYPSRRERPYGQVLQRQHDVAQSIRPTQAYGATDAERCYAFLNRSRHADPVVDEHIGKKCELLSGRPLRAVAMGFVVDVDPNLDFGDRKIGNGNFKVSVDVVHEPKTRLPFPHDAWSKTLEDVVQDYVIWPKDCLQFSSQNSIEV